MFKRALPLFIWHLAGLALAGCAGHTSGMLSSTTGHAQVRGISLYYESHGQGPGVPLVLLPGGGSTIESTYGRALPLLAAGRRLIAIEEQNHGRSGHRDVPERFVDSADDVAELLQKLGIAQADVLGFSNGASVAMQLALRHPARVRKLVFVAAFTRRSGAPEGFWQAMEGGSFEAMPQPLKDAFLKVNPDPALLRDMYEKDSERMRNFVETSDEAVKSIAAPTLLLAGDRDVVTPEHLVELSRLLPRARLAILPGVHGECLGEALAWTPGSPYPEPTVRLIDAFLAASD